VFGAERNPIRDDTRMARVYIAGTERQELLGSMQTIRDFHVCRLEITMDDSPIVGNVIH
jgi:hypothetical protein